MHDNPALTHAVRHARRIIPVYIHAPDEEGEWQPGAASRWWLHGSLTALHDDLRARGSRLIVRRGGALGSLRELIAETGATLVAWNRLYDPAIVARDTALKSLLGNDGIDVECHNASLLVEPWMLATGDGRPYRVFTAFMRKADTLIQHVAAPAKAPRALPAPARWPRSETIGTLDLLPRIRWDAGLTNAWRPGEAHALERLRQFGRRLARYRSGRDRPGEPGTSRLSPHLHFGEIGPRQLLSLFARDETFRRELLWREFAHHLLFHFPRSPEHPLDSRFEAFRWSNDTAALSAWQRGLTGYPIVDAGMRELWSTGWMHNRVRMIVASLLTKNLQLHWLEGARWFWDTLVDADLANNTLGWQWTAGCGADAAPYYRIFNPMLQTERFDPERRYLRQWVPELARLPDTWIHRPWAAPPEVLAQAGISLGSTYPLPVVDFKESREAALAAYQRLRRAD